MRRQRSERLAARQVVGCALTSRHLAGELGAYAGHRCENGELRCAPVGFRRVVRHDGDARPRRVQEPRCVRVLPEGRRTDNEHDVVRLERRAEARPVRRQVPGELRMVVREPCACAERLLPHGCTDPLGDLDERRPRRCLVGAGADDDSRTLCPGEHRRKSVDRLGGGRSRSHDRACRRTVCGISGGLGPVVHRGDDDGGAPSGRRFVVRTADGAGKVLRADRLVDPDRVVARQALEPPGEERLVSEVTAILLPDDDHERGPVHARGRKRADCIAEPGRGVQERHGRLGPGDRPAGRDPDDRRLVQREHELEILGETGQERHFRRAGICEEPREPPLAKDVDDGVTHGRGGHVPTLTQMI